MLKDFEEYVERYVKTYGYTKEESLMHKIVQIVKKYYEDLEREQNEQTNN